LTPAGREYRVRGTKKIVKETKNPIPRELTEKEKYGETLMS